MGRWCNTRGIIFLWIALPFAHSQDIPTGFTVERYATIWQRNPFVLGKGAVPKIQRSRFESLYLTSWLIEGREEVVFVENADTKDVQKIRDQPNENNLRLIAMHLSPNPSSVEAVISDGHEQGIVKFRFDDQPSVLAQAPAGAVDRTPNPAVADAQPSSNRPANPQDPPTTGLNRPPGARLYPGLPRVHWEGGKPGAPGTQLTRQKNNSSDPAPRRTKGSKLNAN
jgi:hypothetical protein